MRAMRWRVFLIILLAAWPFAPAAAPPSYSGIYPHLAYFNDEGECGTGAVVPWSGRLWLVTYGPHFPRGSSDKLYEVSEDLRLTIRPESVGGTPANRMIHRESRQLFIGPYAIDETRNVRVIPPSVMPGRLTGNARHLNDPTGKIYFATMEEGFYEVDVKSLAVRELFPDANAGGSHDSKLLPGYHGKGAYSGHGRLIYSNNGESSAEARVRPDVEAGVLAEWDGSRWAMVQRNQFTEVTGPGGIFGNDHPDTDPIWSIGWDHCSLILMVLDGRKWHRFRLPKASHAYDGAHGWNTEWPRIREIGEGDRLLMTMHGAFWKFPRTFDATHSGGIEQRSTYLKVIGDFCRWGDRVVFGCDDTAKREFLNTRSAKGKIAGPGQSQSNLWFVLPAQLNRFGPKLGRGAVWLDEPVRGGVASDPFLFGGFERRTVHLAHELAEAVTFRFEVDRGGDGHFTPLRDLTVPAKGYAWVAFEPSEKAAWIRVTTDRDCPHATAFFHFSDAPAPVAGGEELFRSLIRSGDDREDVGGALLHARGDNKRTLLVASVRNNGRATYELRADMTLARMDDPAADAWAEHNVAIPRDVVKIEPASVLYVDDAGKRWRLPKISADFWEAGPLGSARVDREVVTERDLFNAGGIFYELPAENAGGFAKIRPIATHGRHVYDFCSWRGLLVLSGICDDRTDSDPNVIRSADGRCAVWVGAIDDLWKFGKATGIGGPWLDSAVKKDVPSDPYLLTEFDRKTLTLSHRAASAVRIRVEIDISGTGLWQPHRTFEVAPGAGLTHEFPPAFAAYWLRVVADADTTASAQLKYE